MSMMMVLSLGFDLRRGEEEEFTVADIHVMKYEFESFMVEEFLVLNIFSFLQLVEAKRYNYPNLHQVGLLYSGVLF